MRKHDAARAEARALLLELGIVDVKADLRLPVAALTDEEIDVAGAAHELLGPARITRIEDRLAVEPHLEAERGLALLVRHRERLDLHAADLDVVAGTEYLEADRIGRRAARR